MDVAQSNIDLAAIDRLIKTAAQTVPILVACFVAAFLLPPLARLFFPNVPTIHVQIEEGVAVMRCSTCSCLTAP